MSSDDRGHALRGRDNECGVLDRLLKEVRAGHSQALVVRGEPGVGKSALLEYVIQSAFGCRVSRAAGVEYEMELAYAGLHQLCAPMLDLRERLPEPQRDALETAFGLSSKRPRTGSSSVWPSSVCFPRPRRSNPSSGSSTTPSGWTGRQR